VVEKGIRGRGVKQKIINSKNHNTIVAAAVYTNT